MPIALLVLPSLAAILLAAHFYRAGQLVLAALSVGALALLAVPRPWAARVLQVALLAGALEWLRTLALFASARMAMGQPYLRLALILVAVAAFTAVSAVVFQQSALRRRYRL
jgi:ABC-type dipeptide/oligopeptide/nickel transport system permease component